MSGQGRLEGRVAVITGAASGIGRAIAMLFAKQGATIHIIDFNLAAAELVVAEIKAIAPKGTEIVDPFDGKIKLTAIQTSQSVADEKGQEVR